MLAIPQELNTSLICMQAPGTAGSDWRWRFDWREVPEGNLGLYLSLDVDTFIVTAGSHRETIHAGAASAGHIEAKVEGGAVTLTGRVVSLSHAMVRAGQ